jgi:hypothetical protein
VFGYNIFLFQIQSFYQRTRRSIVIETGILVIEFIQIIAIFVIAMLKAANQSIKVFIIFVYPDRELLCRLLL